MRILALVLGVAVATPFLANNLASQQLSPQPSVSPGGGQPGAANTSLSNHGQKINQTLGPWELTPPDSASLVAGTLGSPWGWMNVANAAVSLDQAMTSSPIEAQSFANAFSDTVVEVSFSSGVTNNAGGDVVMLDAAFDSGLYLVSTDFDGFASKLSVDMTGGIFVAAVSYYYEHNAGGPFGANVNGVEIDLTDLGVPAGTSVTSLRFECTSSACDPVSLAKIDGGFSLEILNLVAGSTATASATNGTPGGAIGIAMSRAGNAPTLVNTGACGSMLVNLQHPITVLAIGNADANGDLSTSGAVPSNAAGLTLYFQALDFGSCTLSNAVTQVVL